MHPYHYRSLRLKRSSPSWGRLPRISAQLMDGPVHTHIAGMIPFPMLILVSQLRTIQLRYGFGPLCGGIARRSSTPPHLRLVAWPALSSAFPLPNRALIMFAIYPLPLACVRSTGGASGGTGERSGDDLHRTQGRRRRALSQVEKTGLHRAIQLMRPRFDLLRTDSEEEIRTIG